ncbi:hemerythrin domain-containing protein [Parapusillimonas granuli]|uniref:Hemerythrin domain-containing protein n=1 Tax=Parapusillimonas granuli TaxID=380911 RepID=A0A853G4R2_9BURK|nr:hemerythrin domain-containing protein [Parapusillimonas granuli]MBB5215900.1 hemerythrin superfamily protein [Parapusillimonas granuli]MEB2399409.1 hemerythrin domain-containing protein [Alcaligenaceae bacterium]NYT50802.1 hemerythrin domain-containing protein [Parapusillimonas granuli]
MNKSRIPAAQKEVLSLLLDDHKRAKQLFKDFESQQDDAAKEDIAHTVCMELQIHTELEERHFYPFLRRQDPEAFGDLLDEAKVEHDSAKSLIGQILSMKPGDDLYDAKVIVLGEYVSHHVKEEEEELFPQIISKKIDLREMLDPMMETKERMQGQLAPATA